MSMEDKREATLAPAPAQGWSFSINPAFRRGVVSLLLAAVVWELTADYVIKSRLFFAPLSAVFHRMGEMWAAGTLQTDIFASLQTFCLGFAIGSVVALFLAVLMALSDAVRDYLDPLVSALYSTPYIALAPLFVLWFGIGTASHAAVVFLGVFFPVLINSYNGLVNVDRVLIEVAQSFCATERQAFMKVRFPAALPFIVTGLRLGVSRGLVGVVVAEIFGAKAGLGYRIMISGNSFDTAGLFVGIFLFAAAGVVSVELLKLLERRLAPWRFQGTGA
jgi:NitT/TauT family transport system permease protein